MSFVWVAGAGRLARALRLSALYRSFGVVAVGNIGSSAVTFLGLALLAHIMPTRNFAPFAVDYAVVAVAVGIADARTTTLRAVGIHEGPRARNHQRIWRWSSVLVCAAIVSAIRNRVGLTPWDAAAIGVAAGGTSEFNAWLAGLQGSHRFRGWSAGYLGVNVMKVVGMVMVAPAGSAAVIAAYGVIPGVGAALASTWRGQSSPTGGVVQSGIPLVLTAVLTTLSSRLDVVLVASAGVPAATAAYGKMSILLAIPLLLVATLTIVLLPSASYYKDNWHSLVMACGALGLLTTLTLIALIGFALLDVSFRVALPILAVIAPAIILASITAPLSTPLYLVRSGLLLAAINVVELVTIVVVWGERLVQDPAIAAALARSSSIVTGSVLTLAAVVLVTRTSAVVPRQ